GGEPGELGFEAQRVDLLQAFGDRADGEGPRAVRAVAVDNAARVDDDEDAALNGLVPRNRVRARSSRSCCDDGLERDPLGTFFPAAALDPTRELGFGAAGEALARERGKDLVRQRAGSTHDRELLGVLDGTQLLDESRAWNCVDAGVHERSIEGVRKMLLLEADRAAGELLADCRDETARDLRELGAFDRRSGVRIPEVRVDGGFPVRLDKNRRVRALETSQVADVRLATEHVRRPRAEEGFLAQRVGAPCDE